MPNQQIEKVKLSEFVSSENSRTASRLNRFPIRERRWGEPTAQYKRGNKKESETKNNARSMLTKIGVCAAACALVLLLKWIDTPMTNAAIDSVKIATGEESEFDEMLGKLRFVELPGILSVFSSNDKFPSPVEFTSASIGSEDTVLALSVKTRQTATAASNVMVKTIGMDEVLGQYVSLITKDDVEISYYGLTSVTVEEGQLLRPADDVGGIAEEGTLYITVRKGGQPMRPLDYFNITIDGDV